MRVCGDFKDSIYPCIEEICGNLAGGKHFSKLDLRQAYRQMVVTDVSYKYLTINTHKDLFRYNRLILGIASSPSVWQRAFDQVLQRIPGTQRILDDTFITGKTDKEILENLENDLLKRLQDAGLKANKEKCTFFKNRVKFKDGTDAPTLVDEAKDSVGQKENRKKLFGKFSANDIPNKLSISSNKDKHVVI